ncbi:hypothetical protein HKX48_000971 [Thoreauomyces humboldtii]|nr:hypothetical protein HKX48_000971 [Thoreauomyces humboldtii]
MFAAPRTVKVNVSSVVDSKRLSRAASSVYSNTTHDSGYRSGRSSAHLGDSAAGYGHRTRSSTRDSDISSRKTPAPSQTSARSSTTLAKPYAVPNSRILRSQSNTSQNVETVVTGRISEATRRRMEQRAAINVEVSRPLVKPAPLQRPVVTKRSARVEDVGYGQTVQPERASKRAKPSYADENVRPTTELVLPSKRIRSASSRVTTSRASVPPSASVAKKPTVARHEPAPMRVVQPERLAPVTNLRTETARAVRQPCTAGYQTKSDLHVATIRQTPKEQRVPLRPVSLLPLASVLPTPSSLPTQFRTSCQTDLQRNTRELEASKVKARQIRTPRRLRSVPSAGLSLLRHPPGAPRARKLFPEKGTSGSTIFELDNTGVTQQELELVFVPEYAEEIHAYLRFKEDSLCPNLQYAGAEIQPELNWDMRRVLVNWLVQLHTHFHLLPETFFLAINIMDRFMSARTVQLHNFHLVAVCSLMLASKYEQNYAPKLDSIIAVCENQYKEKDIRTGERYIVTFLRYELTWPSPLTFVRRLNEADAFDPRHRMLASYLLELAQLDERLVGIKPSVLASAAYLAACQILNLSWTDRHTRLATYCADQLRPHVMILLEACYAYLDSAVGEKYAQDAYFGIAKTLPAYLEGAGYQYTGKQAMMS